MGLVRRMQAAAPPLFPSPIGPNPSHSLIREPFFAARSQAGKTVTVDTALRFDAVWACIRFRANVTSMMPMYVYERLDGTDYQPAPSHRSQRVLYRPNGEHTPSTLWKLTSAHVNANGNFYWGKTFDARGQVQEVWPIPSQCVEPFRENGQKYYWVRDVDTMYRYPEPFTDGEIIHFMGFSMDGLVGLSPVGYARETIGAGLAMDHFLNVFWRNAGVPPLVLTSDQELSDAARKRMRREWQRMQGGFRNAWRTAILEQGVKPETLSLSLPDAEFVATGEHTITKICRWFGLWPSMVGADTGKDMTYKNLEGEALRTKMFSMNPEWTAYEQALEHDQDLFGIRPGDTMSQFFPRFDRDKFLEVDPLTQAKIDSINTGGRASEFPSEVRKRRTLPPDPRIDDPTLNPPGSAPTGGSAG